VTGPAAKAAEAKPKPHPNSRFVARQPILTKEEKVFGYELLFRDGVENYFCPSDAEAASRSTVDTSMLIGLDVLCDGRRAFVNCTRDMLLKDYVTLLPSQQTVVEILESVEVDDLQARTRPPNWCYRLWCGRVSVKCFHQEFSTAIPTCFCLDYFP
jgi:hypothetical protein